MSTGEDERLRRTVAYAVRAGMLRTAILFALGAAAVSAAGFFEAGGDFSTRAAIYHLAAGGLAVMAARSAGLAGDE
ncbi:MAG: hypothetical protein BGO49_11540 [Planctomycetales bacterium 71-10]|nr:MAG: hypothetical protein BGO49_11540 [Planctomycetales bacterium 71-10]